MVIEISSLKPNLEPLTIITNIISNEDNEIIVIQQTIKKNMEINKSSNLKSIEIIFFRHQHILKILIIIIKNLKLIKDYSTSKVDILNKLIRTFGKFSFFIRSFFCN